MTSLAVADGVTRAASYSHAVLSFVDRDGYPVAVAGPFRTDAATATVQVGPLSEALLPDDGQEVCLIFSHIRPQPGVGYDERRYVNLWGSAEVVGDRVRVRAVRATGWDEAEVPFFEYAERSVGTGRSYLDRIGRRPRLSPIWTFTLATRLPFLTATIVPVALGGAVAAHDSAFRWGWFLLCLLAGAAAHLGLNIVNDLADDVSGADAANVTPTPFSGGSRVLQYGLVSRRGMLTLCLSCYTIAILIGCWLAAARTWWLLALGVVAVILSVEYTAPPLRFVHRGLGEPVVAAGFGPIMALGTYLAVTGHGSWEVFWVSLPVGFLCALILYVNQVPDRVADAAVGKRTLIVRWPQQWVIRVYVGTVAVSFLLLVGYVLIGLTPAWTLLALLAAPLAVPITRGLRRFYTQPFALIPTLGYNIALHLGTGLLLLAGYLLAGLTG